MDKDARIYIAGHTGLIGSAVSRCLAGAGFSRLLQPTHAELELSDADAVRRYFEQHRPDYVVLAAGQVGGIIQNQTYPADLITNNLAIQLNVIKIAHAAGVRRLLFFASSCMYPRECAQPMSEDMLLTGKPEPTSMAYAAAKLAGVQMCLAYNQQFGETRFIPLIPNSVYGPNDDFNPGSSHVLSALLHRFHEAMTSGAREVTLWGSGTPRREFIHADDLAAACLMLLSTPIFDVPLPINVGSGKDISIQELAEKAAKVTGFSGNIRWDTSKPDGAPRKLLDSSRIQGLGWSPSIDLERGLEDTYRWYLSNIRSTAQSPLQ